MRIPHYLVLFNGIWYFRIKVPLHVQATLNRKVVKFSLQTRELPHAQRIALHLQERYHAFFHSAKLSMAKNPDISDFPHLVGEKAKSKIKPYEVEMSPDGAIRIKADSEADHKMAIEAIKEIRAISPGADVIAARRLQMQTPLASLRREEEVEQIISMADGIEKYEANITGSYGSTKTVQKKIKELNDFRVTTKIKRVVDISRTKIYEYEASLRAKPFAPNSVATSISTIRVFMTWAMAAGFYPDGENPASKLGRMKNGEKDRRAEEFGFVEFSKEEIQKIFDPNNMKSLGTEVRWGLLIALHTGMRVNEIGQLYQDNIVVTDKVSYIDIVANKARKQKLKTPSSARKLPIHPRLVEMGFFDYIEKLRQSSTTEQLFNNANFDTKNGPGNFISKGFSYYLKKLKIKAPTNKKHGVHSLRNNVGNQLQKGKVDLPTTQEILGHTVPGVTKKFYLQKISPEVLADMMTEPLTWEFLDVSGITKLIKSGG